MNKWYFGFPLILLLAFGVYFWQYKVGYDRAKELAVAEAKAEFARKKKEDHEKQVLAIEANNRLTEENERLRKAEREREEAEKAARDEANAELARVSDELRRLGNTITTLNKDIEVEQSLTLRATNEITALQAEKDFLAGYVKLAESNAARMLVLVDKVDAAAKKVKEMNDAALAAAAATSKKS